MRSAATDLRGGVAAGGSGGGGGGAGGSLDQGPMHSFVDANGDFWMVANATLSGGVWNRINTSKFSYAMQWIINGVIPGEELIDPIGGLVFWRCIPGANPIGPFSSFGGWENVFLFTQYRDPVVGGQAIEIDGAGTFPFGRVIHAPEGTWIGKNAYADLNGRDDANADSLILGVFGDAIKAKLWPANQPKSAAVDLLTLDKDGDLSVAGAAPGGGGMTSFWKGPWDGATAYPVDSIVQHGGFTYFASGDMAPGVEPGVPMGASIGTTKAGNATFGGTNQNAYVAQQGQPITAFPGPAPSITQNWIESCYIRVNAGLGEQVTLEWSGGPIVLYDGQHGDALFASGPFSGQLNDSKSPVTFTVQDLQQYGGSGVGHVGVEVKDDEVDYFLWVGAGAPGEWVPLGKLT